MRKVTIFLAAVFLMLMQHTDNVLAQETDYVFTLPTSDDFMAPFRVGAHSGARGVSGPWDADGDGMMEVFISEYTGGGRVHVIENTGVDSWELVYSTPWLDSTATSNNGRYAIAGDLDGDGNQEIIMVAGSSYSLTNPNTDVYGSGAGVFVFEHTGEDNDFGDFPASVFKFDDAANADIQPVSTGYAEVLHALDIDGDDVQELLIPLNGSSAWDLFFVYSVNGTFEPEGAGTGFETWVQEFKTGARLNDNSLGGGSAIAMYPADLNGDGQLDISIHAWNFFNFFNVAVLGSDSYAAPEEADENKNIRASEPDDHVAIYGGVAVDINGDGTDEVFYPRFQSFGTAAVSVLDYDQGANILEITPDDFVYDALSPLANLHLVAGDADDDGKMELYGNGRALGGAGFTAGDPFNILRVAEFGGGINGDPTDVSNYSIQDIFASHPLDSTVFNRVFRDSLGTMTDYYEPVNDALAPAKLAYLGDVDGDGFDEIAAAFQVVADSISIIDEVWNPDPDSSRYDRTVRETIAVPERPFLRIIEINNTLVSTDRDPEVPSGFKLSPNYPNPFNPSTTFSFTLPRDARVSVKIYDITGRLIKTLVDNRLHSSGTYQATWDGTSAAGITVASGTYFYSLEHDGTRQVRPMLLVK